MSLPAPAGFPRTSEREVFDPKTDDAGGSEMAELTNIETKLGEVLGLAMAAQVSLDKVIQLAEEEGSELVRELQQTRREAEETEQRCLQLVDGFEGKKTAIKEEAADVKSKGATMLKTYLDADADALDGFEFLTMAEAAEVGHWAVLGEMGRSAGQPEIAQLVSWALPIQQQHFDRALSGSKQLAAQEDPNEVSG
jgi:vacuolar-type H+-ATPase subunit H